MRLLILTNLYPPQELGGYGRCMADFAWGLQQRGHQIQVLTSDTAHLGPSSPLGPSGEPVARGLLLKGSYEGGVKPLTDQTALQAIGSANATTMAALWQNAGPFDGVLVGNIDLLGVEVLDPLLRRGVPVLHHIGFMNAPFHPQQRPNSRHYQLVAASRAVSQALVQAGLGNSSWSGSVEIPVVYPGVRSDLFGAAATGRGLPAPLDCSSDHHPLGSQRHPLRVCFAGLLMGSKGAHTLVQALVMLKQRGIVVEGHLAGGSFQSGYREQLEALLRQHGLDGVRFTGQLTRSSLARCFRLHHVCVFPSIHPEAFGIVGAEAMASGLVLVSSGVGGAAELFSDQESGLRFQAGDAHDLAERLSFLCRNPSNLNRLAQAGEARARQQLSVPESARQLEELLLEHVRAGGTSVRLF